MLDELPDLDRVELLCLDAGNTVVFLDHEALARTACSVGFTLDVGALVWAEGEVKRRLSVQTGAICSPGAPRLCLPLDDADIPAPWSSFVGTMVALAGGYGDEEIATCVRALWREHAEFNLWRRVPDGLIEALAALRATGVRVCIVSNSEGRLDELFSRVGLSQSFDHVIDSALVGVEKPDPRIFELALERFGVDRARVLHLGDTVATDIEGARRAGIAAALLDATGHYEGLFAEVPRVRDVAQVAHAIVAANARRGG